jgi:hypothetical protein
MLGGRQAFHTNRFVVGHLQAGSRLASKSASFHARARPSAGDRAPLPGATVRSRDYAGPGPSSRMISHLNSIVKRRVENILDFPVSVVAGRSSSNQVRQSVHLLDHERRLEVREIRKFSHVLRLFYSR